MEFTWNVQNYKDRRQHTWKTALYCNLQESLKNEI